MIRDDVDKVVTEVKRKLADGSEITRQDIRQLADAARSSGRIEHRVLFAEAKRIAASE